MPYSNTTNLYASRVYAENPLALWALDDDYSFVSEISESNKNIENWAIFNATASAAVDVSNVTQIPFPDEALGGINKNSGSNYITYLWTLSGINTQNLDQSKSTICINTNVWKNTNLVNNYQIGFALADEQQGTGGTVSSITINQIEYWVHTFTSGSTVFNPNGEIKEIEYLIVGGGGGGSSTTVAGGGGGAGGLLTNVGGTKISTSSLQTIVVGNGAPRASGGGSVSGTNGENSSAFGLIALGGGRSTTTNGGNGGSGGGGAGRSTTTNYTGGLGTSGQGNNGGNGFGSATASQRSGGGGGGAGSVGQNASASQGGNGGSGILNDINGTPSFYAAGGGGSSLTSGGQGIGGSGIGGNGGIDGDNATDGVVNTGSGGGGATRTAGTVSAGAGGSGIVIIRYPKRIFSQKEVSYFIPESSETGWQKISHTFNYPASATIYPYLEIEFEQGGSVSDYTIYCNALSVGQWSEKFHTDSTGIFPQSLSSSVSFYQLLPETSASVKYITTDSYGLTTINDGYYILENNKMLGVNNGLPMVFGSSNITNLYPPETENMPSIVIPGKGFLNRGGKYKQLTAEFWLRIYNGSQTLKKIFGPLSSKDGLYVEEEFLTLRLGKYQKSYFIGKWYRPMLVDIVYTPQNVSLLINGISVMNLDILVEELDLPRIEFDWLGFYAHNDVQPFELDCVAVYPYAVSDELAKRRFVYGQGVEYPDIVSSKFGGDSAFIDYSFSKYTSEFAFPNRTKWNSGFFSNLETNSQELTFTQYQLPEIQFFGTDIDSIDLDQYQNIWSAGLDLTSWLTWTAGKTWFELLFDSSLDFYVDNYRIQNDDPYTFISMIPNEIFENEGIYPNIFFNSINMLTSPVSSMFGVFENSASVTMDNQILFKVRNRLNQNYFEVYKNSSSVIYNFYNGTNNILNIKQVTPSSKFIAGIDINEISRQYKRIVENFFDFPQNLSLSLGGFEENVFKGKIYSFTFNNRFFTDKDTTGYFQQGFASTSASPNYAVIGNDDFIMKYVGNYSLLPTKTAREIKLEIGSSGYWEGIVPLSILGKNIVKSNGETFYDLDMIQFNIDFPSPVITSQSPPAEENDTRLKSYITLQDFRRVGSIPYTNWASASNITTNRVIDFDNTIDVIQSKYEIVDGTIIFPPKELIDFKDYYIVVHLEMSTRSIESMPIKLQRMSLASLSFDESAFYPIGTKTGKELYPFTRYDNAYYPKEKNPILIYKGSTPYLYLTDDSGISVLDYSSNATSRGITMPINQSKAPTFSLGGIQMWMFYKESETFDFVKTIGMINTPEDKIEIILSPEDNGKRAKMFLFDLKTGLEYSAVKFYQNGNLVTNPYIEPMQWTSIVMSLGTSIEINAQSGQLELYNGVLFNNIAFFEKLTDVFAIVKDFLTWITVDDENWSYWTTSTWADILGEVTIQEFALNGIEVFNSYLGLSKVIVSDNKSLRLNSEKVDKFMNITWSQFVGRPV